MSAEPVDSDAPAVALVGATSLIGREVKEQLASAGYPSGAVVLLDLEEAAGLLTEYGEDARVVVDAAERELARHSVVCFCGDVDFTRRYLPEVTAAGSQAIDCTGAFTDDPEAVLMLPGVTDTRVLGEGAPIVLPSVPTLLLGTALTPLAPVATGAVATLLLPASECGEDGIDELAAQTSAVMSLEDLPQRVFGRQLAFDLWPATVPGSHELLADEIADELGRLGLPVPALCVLRAPVFHAVSTTLYLPQSELQDTIERIDYITAGLDEADERDSNVDSPVRTAGKGGLHAGASWPDPRGGCWLWLTMDNVHAVAASAVATIQALVGPPGSRAV